MLSRGSASGKMKAEPSILHSHTEYGNEENEEQSMGTRKRPARFPLTARSYDERSPTSNVMMSINHESLVEVGDLV